MTKLNKTPGKNYWKNFLSQESIPRSVFDGSDDLPIVDAKKIFEQFVCIVNIETSTYCNRLCHYCPVSTFDRKNQILMQDKTYSRIITDLESIDYSSTISLNLYNEPLIDSKLMKRISEARESLPKSFIKFNSNGDALNKDILDRLVDLGVNALFITLHPATKQPWNHKSRLIHFENFFKRIQVDYSIDEIIPDIRISSEVNYYGLRLLVQAHNWGKIGNDRGGAVPLLSSDSRSNPCVRPIREFTISYDGSVYPCCQFFADDINTQKYKVGTITDETSIFRIYTSYIMSQWRKHLFTFGLKKTPCSSCKDPDFANELTQDLREKIIHQLEESQSDILVIHNLQDLCTP